MVYPVLMKVTDGHTYTNTHTHNTHRNEQADRYRRNLADSPKSLKIPKYCEGVEKFFSGEHAFVNVLSLETYHWEWNWL